MIAAVYGQSVNLAVESSTPLHTSILLAFYTEVERLEKTYSVDMMSVQSIGTPREHQTIGIMRVVAKLDGPEEERGRGDDIYVAGVVVIFDNQMTAAVDQEYADLAEAFQRASENSGRDIGRPGVTMMGESSNDLLAQMAGPTIVEAFIKDIFGEPEKKEKEE